MNRFMIFCLILSLSHRTTFAQRDEVKASLTEEDSACDSQRFIESAIKAEELRKTRRVDAEEFKKMASEPNTLILDARGKSAFENLHVRGAVNLPYTEFSETSLAHVIPDKSTRILLYCRNNLISVRVGMNADLSQPRRPGPDLELEYEKGRSAGLNIPTYITLYIYGYRNVWELKPAVDPNNTSIEFVRPWEERHLHENDKRTNF